MQQPDTSGAGSSSPSPPPSVLDYLLVIAKHRRMIFLTTFGAALITALITLLLPSIYTAKAMVIPIDDDKGGMSVLMSQLSGLAGMAGAAGGAIGAKTTGNLYVTMLKSETVKDPIIDRFKLIDLYEAKYRSDVYKKLDEIAVVSLGKKDGVVTIMVDDKDPKRVADMANAYVEELGKLAAGLNMAGAGKNRLFLEKRIAEARADLSRAEDALKNFQSKNKAISVTDQAQATIAGVAQLRAQLAIKEVELGTLKRQFTDTSQEVKTARAMVANLRAQIGGLEGKGGGTSSMPTVGNMPQLGQEYMRLMREFKIQEAVVEMLTKQYEVSKLSETKDVAPFQVLQKATVPERRTKPKRLKLVMLAGMFTFALTILAVFSLESFRSMSDAEKKRWKSIIKRDLK
jgi:tyrosine-protein kinase Etk/Wzc